MFFRIIALGVVLSIVASLALPLGRTQAASNKPTEEHSTALLDAPENSTYQTLPFSQNWSDTGLITTDDDWTNVPGIVGFRGDAGTPSIPTDPTAFTGDFTVIDVNANQTNPNTFGTGGVAEFQITDPVVALQGSGTADVPNITFYLDTNGRENITVAYNVRDIDGSMDNAVQPVALQYRVGESGSFTNVPTAYISDATTGPSLATLVTPISVLLPYDTNNQPKVQVRVMTGNATGNDEWVGIDDISVTGDPLVIVPEMLIVKTGPSLVEVNQTFTYTLSVTNNLDMEATGVVITDSLPISLTYQSSSDGGVLLASNVVSWTIDTMADDESAIRTIKVTAPITEGILTNSDYGVWASNWLTRTVDGPVITTVKDPYAITPIGTARAAGQGWYGTLQGNVTVPLGIFSSTYQSFVIQDDTGGIYIYAPYGKSLPPMVLGDVIQVYGKIKNYSGMLEIDPLYTATWIDSGTVPAPLATATSAVNGTQGKLIQITGTASWSEDPPDPGDDDWSFSLNDGSGAVTVFVDKDTNIDMLSYTSPMSMTVIGFSSTYYSTPEVLPRYQSDIIDLSAPAVTATDPANSATGANLYHPVMATFNKAMNASTINTASFTISDTLSSVSGVVSYEAGSRKAIFTPNAALSASTVYTATLTTEVKDSYDIPLAAPYIWSFTTGAVDDTPPAITGRFPLPDAVDVSLSANIVIIFTEDLHPTSLNQGNFILEGPYGSTPYALSYNATTFVVTLDPSGRLLPTSEYTVIVKGTTADWAGLTLGTDDVWSFETSVEPPMQVFLGDIHNHTSYSDGSGTPSEALAAGEDAGYDFMAITDHSYAVSDSEWDDTLSAVNTATDSDFVALRGFEYTQGAEGHINVYNSVTHATRTDVSDCDYCDFTPNLEQGVTVQGFYNWLVISGTIGIDADGTVMQFNHPGWINFNDWTYHSEVSSVARLEEVGNGNGTSYMFSEDEYLRSLDYGWKLGVTNNADTHTADWGVNTDHRTGAIMSGLTKSALLEALRERRTYATEDKNYSLTMKTNGAWMGSEIANSGSVLFEIEGSDPDSELTTLVQLITDQGEVAAQLAPNQASFTWQPQIDITTGVHYFYVKAVQTDGDRIVSSPVWTMGDEDISITDIVIQPTVPTTNNPSLLTARVTNRVTSSRTVTVTMDVDGVPLTPSVVVIVPPNGDAYANFSWQPTETGDVTVTATLQGAPAGDNPDDNSASLNLTVTDEFLPLILIDAGKNNTNAVGREMRMFIEDLSDHSYNVLKNLDDLTVEDLDPNVVKLLIITAPQYAYDSDELSAIADYVAAGGSLWLCGLADYTGKVPWADTVATRMNAILARIEQEISTNINMRMNDDEVIDGNTNNGYVFGVAWSDFPAVGTTSIGTNVEKMTSWSLNSIRGRGTNEPLTSSTSDVQIVVQGDLDVGYTSDSWHNPFHTSNTDADSANDAYIYNPTWVYPADPPADPIPLPMAAATQLPGGAGRIMLYGDSSDAFTTFAYTAGDGLQNELFNLEAVMWLLGEPLIKSTIAEARAQAVEDQPDNLDRLVWVEGKITAAYGEFFNVLHVQDDTGGITVHAPAGDIDPGSFTRGTEVRVVGTVGIYNGDTEIEFFEAEMVQVITPSGGEVLPMPLTTYQASLEENQGWLGVITGTVTSKTANDTIIVDDGSGPVRVFLDGYNGDFDDIFLNDLVRVTGLVSEDGNGARIRVRNYQTHPEYAEDVVKLEKVGVTGFDLMKSVDEATWDAVDGSMVSGFAMTLDPAEDWYYLDVANLTANRELKVGFHPFYVTSTPAGWLAYWAAKGVDASAIGWQGWMYQIITGSQPIFYLKVTETGGVQSYKLVDGLLKDFFGMDDEYLRVDGTYLLGEYTFTGTISDDWSSIQNLAVNITFEAMPEITGLDLVQSNDKVAWLEVEGSLSGGFDMVLNPAVSFYYLDVDNVVTNKPLAEGYHPFYVDTYPTDFFVYWDGRGVNASADPLSWQGVMWKIINGDLPIFYLKVSSDGSGGQLFRLVDGLVYQTSGTDEYLRLDGTYLRGEYTYTGSIEDVHGAKSPLTVSLDLYYGYWYPWVTR
jgi:uncharacterized repeat protein (TIGR01451 family)